MRYKHRIKHSLFSEWRYYLASIFSFMTFGLLFICFVTPYWLQSWSRIHTSFNRLGLWEFCLKGYVQRLDPNKVSYFDCWWILSPYYGKIFNYLVPSLMFIAIVVFGINYNNPNWMPQPKFNWPSWSYGCAILGNLSAIYAALCFGMMEREMRRDIQELVHNFPLTTKLKHRRHWKLRRYRWEKRDDEVKMKELLETPGKGLKIGSVMQLSRMPSYLPEEGQGSNLGGNSHISSVQHSLPGTEDDDEFEDGPGMSHQGYRPMPVEV